MSANRQIRVTALIKRKEGVSKEDFDDYFYNEFPKAFASLDCVKGKVIKYDHGEVDDHIHDVMSAAGFKVHPYDAQVVIEAFSWKAVKEIFLLSDEYRTRIGSEVTKYVDRDAVMFASNVKPIVDLRPTVDELPSQAPAPAPTQVRVPSSVVEVVQTA